MVYWVLVVSALNMQSAPVGHFTTQADCQKTLAVWQPRVAISNPDATVACKEMK